LVVNVVKGDSPTVSDAIKIVKILRNTDSDSGNFYPLNPFVLRTALYCVQIYRLGLSMMLHLYDLLAM